jgi:hypothetical protein
MHGLPVRCVDSADAEGWCIQVEHFLVVVLVGYSQFHTVALCMCMRGGYHACA